MVLSQLAVASRAESDQGETGEPEPCCGVGKLGTMKNMFHDMARRVASSGVSPFKSTWKREE